MELNTDFTSIGHLKTGSYIQQKTYQIITEYNVLEILSKYNPIVVGTIPIDIHIDSSDVDIILESNEINKLAIHLESQFIKFKSYHLEIKNENILICKFSIEDLPFEIYACPTKTIKQNGYRHMLIENEILNHFGKDFKEKIKRLKIQGYKTEPAFCKLLDLKGDPYISLLEYKIN